MTSTNRLAPLGWLTVSLTTAPWPAIPSDGSIRVTSGHRRYLNAPEPSPLYTTPPWNTPNITSPPADRGGDTHCITLLDIHLPSTRCPTLPPKPQPPPEPPTKPAPITCTTVPPCKGPSDGSTRSTLAFEMNANSAPVVPYDLPPSLETSTLTTSFARPVTVQVMRSPSASCASTSASPNLHHTPPPP
eukprot:3941149-Rhodomonas_salina.2